MVWEVRTQNTILVDGATQGPFYQSLVPIQLACSFREKDFYVNVDQWT